MHTIGRYCLGNIGGMVQLRCNLLPARLLNSVVSGNKSTTCVMGGRCLYEMVITKWFSSMYLSFNALSKAHGCSTDCFL
jgi:hypothetical protein